MVLNVGKLKQLRKQKSWSQEVLAKASGLSLRTIQRIESDGRASAESTLAIASALEVSPTALQSSSEQIDVNWTRKMIMHSAVALLVISVTIGILFKLGGEASLYFDWIGLSFVIAFIYAATIVAYGVDGMLKSLSGFRYLFSGDIVGGAPAKHLARIYASQIWFGYGAALIGVLIGSVAIHSNTANMVEAYEIHQAYAINISVLVYAAIIGEALLRPLQTKLATCDMSE
ncbi:helix-turn-helix transcriptional regulator [Corallincola platygyrae]|uniref:Helix-turn-helix transcriptional regulator n=1 Tax=Corallincola platygyrae TaxID=1193278 RepID=A0ABW4XRN3_9GAMM